jgi:hypothetical protein
VPGTREPYLPSTTTCRLIVAAAICCALVAGLIVFVSSATAASRTSTTEPEVAMLTKVWADHRIVVDAHCVEVNHLTARYACQLDVATKPPKALSFQWDKIGAAVRSGNVDKLILALGIPSTASDAEIDAILHRWNLDRTRVAMIGLSHTAGRWGVTSSPLTAAGFSYVGKVQSVLRQSVPSMEQWFVDHGTYATATGAKLRNYDNSLPAGIVVVGTKNAYCVSWTLRGVTMSLHRPDTTYKLGHC